MAWVGARMFWTSLTASTSFWTHLCASVRAKSARVSPPQKVLQNFCKTVREAVPVQIGIVVELFRHETFPQSARAGNKLDFNRCLPPIFAIDKILLSMKISSIISTGFFVAQIRARRCSYAATSSPSMKRRRTKKRRTLRPPRALGAPVSVLPLLFLDTNATQHSTQTNYRREGYSISTTAA